MKVVFSQDEKEKPQEKSQEKPGIDRNTAI